MIFRFLAALGIGGEWAVRASLLSETWPSHWRHWIAAILQTGVNMGILVATLASFLLAGAPPWCLFLVGVLPAIMVLWIRRSVPVSGAWQASGDDRARRLARLRQTQRQESNQPRMITTRLRQSAVCVPH